MAILSDEGVLVFDSNATPETAATVLAEIRKLTDKPVRYLVNSHWHWDHWGGNQTYQAAFPGLADHYARKDARTHADRRAAMER